MAQARASVLSILQELQSNLTLVCEQLTDDDTGRKPATDFDADEYHKKLGTAAKMISHEATKACLSFSKPPLPDVGSATMLCQNLEMTCLSLVSAFYDMPLSEGMALQKQIQRAVLDVITGIRDLVNGFESSKVNEQQHMTSTGNLWECCEALEKLPRDNKEAVLVLLKRERALVQDAVEELDMAIQNEEDEEDDWTDSEHVLLPSCLGLVKTAKSCLKKVIEGIETEEISATDQCIITDLDNLWTTAEPTSAIVDEFVSSLYPPLNRLTVNENSVTLSAKLENLVELYRSTQLYNADDDESWTQFLLDAIKHNADKVKAVTDQKRAG